MDGQYGGSAYASYEPHGSYVWAGNAEAYIWPPVVYDPLPPPGYFIPGYMDVSFDLLPMVNALSLTSGPRHRRQDRATGIIGDPAETLCARLSLEYQMIC